MQYKELEGKSDKELMSMVTEDRAALHAMRLKTSVNQLKGVRQMREIRKRLARTLTRLNATKKA